MQDNPFAEIALDGSLLAAAPIALLAGLISFLSPCVLPLVPGYLGYVSGLGGAALDTPRRGRVVLGAVLFVLGFTAVVMVMNILFAELAFLVVLYRFWTTWQYYAGAVFVGIVYPILAAASFNLWTMPPWAVAGFFALTIAGCLVGTGLGILIADQLRRAGVARLARRRGNARRGLGAGAGPAGQH